MNGSNYVLENDFPNKDFAFNEENKNKFNNLKSIVKSVRYINISGNENIKKYIVNNGGIASVICYDEKYYNPHTSAMCSPIDKIDTIDWEKYIGNDVEREKIVREIYAHAVTIIGWDDNYSKNNFNSNCRPKNDGAWLILNSWGSNWGNNGTAWISYEDEYVNDMIATGVEGLLFQGEINADFRYTVLGNEYTEGFAVKAYIEVDDFDVEDIDGWTRSPIDSKICFEKLFVGDIEPYTIELHSKADGSSTTINIDFSEGIEKYINSKNQNQNTNMLPMITKITFISIIIVIILIIVIKKMKKEEKTNNLFYKIVTGIAKIFKIIILASLVLGLIALVIFIGAFLTME